MIATTVACILFIFRLFHWFYKRYIKLIFGYKRCCVFTRILILCSLTAIQSNTSFTPDNYIKYISPTGTGVDILLP